MLKRFSMGILRRVSGRLPSTTALILNATLASPSITWKERSNPRQCLKISWEPLLALPRELSSRSTAIRRSVSRAISCTSGLGESKV